MENKEFLTTTELAKILGITRIAVFKKIKKGQIKAIRIGKNFAIPKGAIPEVLDRLLNKGKKKEIDAAVKKTVKEYGQTLKLLGRE